MRPQSQAPKRRRAEEAAGGGSSVRSNVHKHPEPNLYPKRRSCCWYCCGLTSALRTPRDISGSACGRELRVRHSPFEFQSRHKEHCDNEKSKASDCEKQALKARVQGGRERQREDSGSGKCC